MNSVVDSLVVFIGGKDDELRDIAGLGETPRRSLELCSNTPAP
jgi:hypothetical protein